MCVRGGGSDECRALSLNHECIRFVKDYGKSSLNHTLIQSFTSYKTASVGFEIT